MLSNHGTRPEIRAKFKPRHHFSKNIIFCRPTRHHFSRKKSHETSKKSETSFLQMREINALVLSTCHDTSSTCASIYLGKTSKNDEKLDHLPWPSGPCKFQTRETTIRVKSGKNWLSNGEIKFSKNFPKILPPRRNRPCRARISGIKIPK